MKFITSKKTIFLASVIFLGFSFNPKISIIPTKYSFQEKNELKINFNLEGVHPAFAANSNWDSVRDVATFTKNVIKGVDTVLTNLANSGVFNQSTTYTGTSGTSTFRITPTFNGTVTSSALGAKTYKYSFEIWKTSDSSKIFELYFDSTSDKSSGNGVLVIWQPNKFDTALNQSNSAKMECAMSGGSSNGTMICSWNAGPFETSGAIDNGRIKVTANSTNSTVSFKALVRTVVTTTCTGGNNDYFGLGFIVKQSGTTNYATARYGFNDNSIASTLCGTSNTNNSAYFNNTVNSSASDSTKYFVTDGITSDSNSYNSGNNYPSVTDVSTLYSEINSTDTDVTITKVNNISVAFRSTSAP